MGSHDHRRVASKLGSEFVGILNTVNLMLPGVSFTYYGEEIGMTDNYDFPISDSRDPNRTPMQWDGTVSAGRRKFNDENLSLANAFIISLGFSTNLTTWLPINSAYTTINLERLKSLNRSDYHHYIELTNLRKEDTIIDGDIRMKILSRTLFAFTRYTCNIYDVLYLDFTPFLFRELPGSPTYLIIVNLDSSAVTLDLSNIFLNIPNPLTVVASSALSKHRFG